MFSTKTKVNERSIILYSKEKVAKNVLKYNKNVEYCILLCSVIDS